MNSPVNCERATCDNCWRHIEGSPLDHEGPCERVGLFLLARSGCHPEWIEVEDSPEGGQLAASQRQLRFCSTACSMAHGQWERLWQDPGGGERTSVLIPQGTYDKLDAVLGTGRHLVVLVPQALSSAELAQCAAELQGLALGLPSAQGGTPEGGEAPPPRPPRSWWGSPGFQATLRILGVKGVLTAATVPLVLHADPVLLWCLALLVQTLFEVVTVAVVRLAFGQRLSTIVEDEDDDDDDDGDGPGEALGSRG